MKFHTTKKAINNGYTNKIAISYCALQTLLSCAEPIAYTTRQEGWGADIYDIDGIAIVTGYAPFGNIRPDYETIREYEKRAEKIRYNYNLKWDDMRTQLCELLREFIQEATSND